jgi:hypothetical protein
MTTDDDRDHADLERSLRQADPAASHEPLPLWRREALINAATAPRPVSRRRGAGRRRLLVTFSAALVASGVALTVAVPSWTDDPTLVSLPVSGSVELQSSCPPPSTEVLARSSLAFRGTVTSVTRDAVTLRVETVYVGTIDSTVTVSGIDRESQATDAFDSVSSGDVYLVAASDGVVRECGLSGSNTPQLAELYERSF